MKPVDVHTFHTLARLAGTAILPWFQKPITIDNKQQDSQPAGAFDPVTKADKDAEAAMRQYLRQHFPEHGIIGEEYGKFNEEAQWQWVLDPIDGTRAFISGLPTWGTLVGLEHNGMPKQGMIAQANLREIYYGDTRSAMMFRGFERIKLKTRTAKMLKEATLSSTTHALVAPHYQTPFAKLISSARFVRFDVDCYAYAMLALGMMDVVLDTCMQHYDWSALVPVVQGAGGVITDWQGNDLSRDSCDTLACATPQLHAQILSILN